MRLLAAVTVSLAVGASAALLLPLNVDLVWVLQGQGPSFTGFFVEWLGLSSGLRHVFPTLRLVFGAMPLGASEAELAAAAMSVAPDLFAVEADALTWSLSANTTLDQPLPSAPTSAAFGIAYVAPTEGDVPRFCAASNMVGETAYVGGDLARHRAVEATPAAADSNGPAACCRACVFQSLCVAWTWDLSGCSLKGARPAATRSDDGAVSGSLLGKVSDGLRLPLPKVRALLARANKHGHRSFFNIDRCPPPLSPR